MQPRFLISILRLLSIHAQWVGKLNVGSMSKEEMR